MLPCRYPVTALALLLALAPFAAIAQGLGDPRQPELRAQLSPRHQTTLSAQVAAVIDTLPLREGQAFRKGELLVAFDCDIPRAELRRAQAVLDGAQKKFQVNRRLAELESVSTLELEVAQAEARKALAELEIQRLELERCTLHAPFDGRVAALSVQPFQFVKKGEPVMEILDHRNLEMELIVPSRWLTWLAVDTPFTVHVDETGRDYPARVLLLGARVDPVSQSIKVVGAIDGVFEDLMPGMSGSALFPSAPQ